MRESNRFSWWSLNGIVIAAAFLLWWEASERLTPPQRQIVLAGFVFLVYGLIAWWTRANRVALAQEHREGRIRARTRLRVVESIGLEVQNGSHRATGPATPVHTQSSFACKQGMHKSDRPAGPQYPTGQAYQ